LLLDPCMCNLWGCLVGLVWFYKMPKVRQNLLPSLCQVGQPLSWAIRETILGNFQGEVCVCVCGTVMRKGGTEMRFPGADKQLMLNCSLSLLCFKKYFSTG
jgi:hypothetical protein